MTPERFAQLTTGADAEIQLDRAAVAIGRIGTPDVGDARPLAQLDALAHQVRVGLGTDPHPGVLARQIGAVLFDEEGFAGDTEDYYDPLNSCLPAVLERKRGMPILLSLVFMEVGRRSGLAVDGVGAPGHFLVKFSDGVHDRYLDPFNGGQEVPGHHLRAQIRAALGDAVSTDAYLEPVTKRQILGRILTNLKGSYLRRGDPMGALEAVEYQLAMTPWALDEVKDRGVLLAQLGRHAEALTWLRQYREHAPADTDMTPLDQLMARLAHRQGGAGDN